MELLVIIIILSLIFDYINGFHDAANSFPGPKHRGMDCRMFSHFETIK